MNKAVGRLGLALPSCMGAKVHIGPMGLGQPYAWPFPPAGAKVQWAVPPAGTRSRAYPQMVHMWVLRNPGNGFARWWSSSGKSVSLDMSSQGSLGSRVALLLAIARAAAVFLPPGRNTRGVLRAPTFGAGFSRAVATGGHDIKPELHGFGTAEVVALAAASAYFRSRSAAKLPLTTAGWDPSCGGLTSGGACHCCR